MVNFDFNRRILRAIFCYVGLLFVAVKGWSPSAVAQPVFLGQWPDVVRGAEAQSVVVRGDLAYVAGGLRGLFVVNVADKVHPQVVARYDTPGFARQVFVEGGRAYIADSENGLVIVDVADPARPVALGRWDTDGMAEGVFVSDGRAYVADADGGLVIVSVSNPASPTRLGGIATTGRAGGVQVVGTKVYVAEGEAGLQIYEAANPAVPVRLGGFNTDGFALAVQVDGTVAYVADGESGLRILDVTNPAAPSPLAVFATAGLALDVSLDGGVAAVAVADRGWQVVNVQVPGAPVGLATVATRGAVLGIFREGSFAYVADIHSGLLIVDLQVPSAPDLMGETAISGEAQMVDVVNDLAYVADWNGGVSVLDVSQSGAPRRIGGLGSGASAAAVVVVGSVAYVADFRDGMVVFDVSDPSAPARIGGYSGVTEVVDLQVVGNRAYVAHGAGLEILDVTTPANPTRLGGYVSDGKVFRIRMSGSVACLGVRESLAQPGFQLIDVANPSSPVYLGGYEPGGAVGGISLAGTLAYVATSEAGVQILDVSDPTAVSRTGVLATTGFARGVDVRDGSAFVAEDGAGLSVIDVRTPAKPFRMFLRDTRGRALGVRLDGDLAYVADGAGGLAILAQITLINTPPIIGSVPRQLVDEQVPWNFSLSAEDSDLPANLLTFALVSGPAGLTVNGAGVVSWTPTEAQGPSENTVVVKVTDNGVPPLSATNQFVVAVREGNRVPVLAAVAAQTAEEQTAWTVTLSAMDDDRPANGLRYALVSGPPGLRVSGLTGLVSWTPTEGQGPSENLVVVKVTDDGVPPLSMTNQFTVTVSEVNTPPVFAPVATQTADRLTPLEFNVRATDADVPVNNLTYALVRGPEGLTVSAAGAVAWIPGAGQVPSTNTVAVRVMDDGQPALSTTNEFVVVALEVEERAVVQIGIDDDPSVIPYVPYREFQPQNNRNDLPPGQLTRLPGDPEYDPATNPGRDDDFYVRGIYPAGFNGLGSRLTVPNDEPSRAWEHSLSPGDRTNRWHFRLTEAQAAPATWIRVVMELSSGGALVGGQVVGFGEHDVVVRFRNGAGVMTELSATRISSPTVLKLEFPVTNVLATAGANSIEIARTGPLVSGTSFWVTFDYLRMEVDAGGNEAPALATVPEQTVDEGSPLRVTLSATDGDTPPTPLTYGLVSGPAGLTVSGAGSVSWTPTEAQGPSDYPVVVKVTDNGVPPRSTTNQFGVRVREVNRVPVLAAVAATTIDEQKAWTLALSATDEDLPANELTYALVSGPAGLTVSGSGLVSWTPTEAQGPSVNPVVVKVTDNGVPPLSATNEFTVTVREVNIPPALAAVAPQTVDRLAPLGVNLRGTDADIPLNNLTYALVRGPEGLTVSETGAVAWIPGVGQAPSTNTVVVQVLDHGQPALSTTNEFVVVALTVEERAVVEIGIDDDPSVIPYVPYREFDSENNQNDLPPGQVTRLPGDAEYNPAANPVEDDDYYVRGIYPAGFNGLVSRRLVPNDEPWTAWEHSLTPEDRTNRWHFRLTEAQAVPATWIRLVMELPSGGALAGGQVVGFGDHDVVIRFRNGAGVMTELSARRISSPTVLKLEFPVTNVLATAGANSIEIARTGPIVSGTSFWVTFDYLRMEVDAGGNEAPALATVPEQTVDEGSPLRVTLSATDGDTPPTPLTYGLVSGPAGLTVSGAGLVSWTPTEAQGPSNYPVVVKVTDNGVPPRSTTNQFGVRVREVNRVPVLAAVAATTIDEQKAWTLALSATDEDLPANELTYALVSGPGGLTVSGAGLVSWTPTEAQGPSENLVLVKVTDNGVPPFSMTNQFTVTVREVNTPPALAAVAPQTVDRLAPLGVNLRGTDADIPLNNLTYALVRGPEGLTVSETGVVAWIPGVAQAPSTNTVVVQVLDHGQPALSATNEFVVVALAVEERAVVEIGIDDDPSVIPYVPYREFDSENNQNDLPPGLVTRLPGDPEYDPATNPGRDDDYYVRGVYPAGFNGLASRRLVPNDEPWTAWEHSLTPEDQTNRWHFRLTEAQAAPATWIRLVVELSSGGALAGGQSLGFGEHDVAVRFRNGVGVMTELSATRISSPSVLKLEFPVTNVLALAGANSIEIARTGPLVSGTSFWVTFDYLRIEVDAGGNEAPGLATVPEQTVDEGLPLRVTLSATDGDTPPTPLTYGLVSGPAGLTVSGAGLVSWTPTEAQGPSNYPVVVKVTDNGVPPRSTTNQFGVRVREVNRVPVLAAVVAATIDEQKAWTLALSATDEDLPANELTYALVSGPGGLTVSGAGVVNWTPMEAQGPSENTVVVKVTDNGVPPLSATNEFTVTVREVNTPPALAAVPRQLIDELAPLEFGLLGTDEDLPENVLTYSLVSGPPGLSVSGTGVVTWTPTEAQGPSVNTVVVAVTDHGVPPLSATRQFTVEVREVNTAPLLARVLDLEVKEGELLERTLLADDADFPANTLTYSLVSGPAGLSVSSSGLVSWIPTEAQGPSVNPVVVKVTDSGNPVMSGTAQFAVTVLEVNKAPTMGEIPDQVIAEQKAWSLTLTAQDPDLPANIQTFVLVNGPAGMTVSAEGLLRWTPSEGQAPSMNTVVVAVTDGGTPVLGATNRFTVTVTEENAVPVWAEIAPRQVDEFTPFTLMLSAQDPDLPANRLTYALVRGPAGFVITSTGAASWIPDEDQAPSTNTILVKVTDDGSPPLSATNQFIIVAREVNSDPIFVRDTLPGGVELTRWSADGLAVDPDVPANTLAYSILSGPEGLSITPAGIIEWVPAENQAPSTNTVIVKVTDNGSPSLSATNRYSVVIQEVNSPPILTAISKQVIDELAGWTLPLTATDGDLPLNRLQFALVSGPPGLTVSGAGVVTWMPAEEQGPSTNEVLVTVFDDGSPSLRVTNRFSIEVRELNAAPVLNPIPDQEVALGGSLVFRTSATDSDRPRTNQLSFHLMTGADQATLNSKTGEFRWVPYEMGETAYVVRVVDDGSPRRFDEQSFTVRVSSPRMTIREAPDRVIIEFETLPGWTYQVLGLPYFLAGQPSPPWRPLLPALVRGTGAPYSLTVPTGTINTGGLIRMAVTPAVPK